MNIKCPKCGALVECDGSLLYDEFVYNEETCDTCHTTFVYNNERNILFTARHEPTAVAVDVIMRDRLNGILFIKRKFPPHQGKLALPGGFVNSFETCEQAAVREIFEECGLKIYESNLEQIGVFSAPGRDTRCRVISILYQYNAIIDDPPRAGDDAAGCQFVNVFDTKFKTSDLAFDHIDMLWRYYKLNPW